MRAGVLAADAFHVAQRVMGGEQAANTLLTVKLDQLKAQGQTTSAAERAEFMRPTLAMLALGIAASLNTGIPPATSFGVFRM